MSRRPDRPPVVLPSSALERDRRGENRRPLQAKAVLTVLDGTSANTVHDVLMRDQSLSGVSFLLRVSLAVGQTCRIDIPTNGLPGASYLCEVTRSRPVSNGRFEMAVQFRKPM